MQIHGSGVRLVVKTQQLQILCYPGGVGGLWFKPSSDKTKDFAEYAALKQKNRAKINLDRHDRGGIMFLVEVACVLGCYFSIIG
jgi:hypothetical protein